MSVINCPTHVWVLRYNGLDDETERNTGTTVCYRNKGTALDAMRNNIIPALVQKYQGALWFEDTEDVRGKDKFVMEAVSFRNVYVIVEKVPFSI